MWVDYQRDRSVKNTSTQRMSFQWRANVVRRGPPLKQHSMSSVIVVMWFVLTFSAAGLLAWRHDHQRWHWGHYDDETTILPLQNVNPQGNYSPRVWLTLPEGDNSLERRVHNTCTECRRACNTEAQTASAYRSRPQPYCQADRCHALTARQCSVAIAGLLAGARSCCCCCRLMPQDACAGDWWPSWLFSHTAVDCLLVFVNRSARENNSTLCRTFLCRIANS